VQREHARRREDATQLGKEPRLGGDEAEDVLNPDAIERIRGKRGRQRIPSLKTDSIAEAGLRGQFTGASNQVARSLDTGHANAVLRSEMAGRPAEARADIEHTHAAAQPCEIGKLSGRRDTAAVKLVGLHAVPLTHQFEFKRIRNGHDDPCGPRGNAVTKLPPRLPDAHPPDPVFLSGTNRSAAGVGPPSTRIRLI
jgi:hypothetical protein